MSNMRVAFNFNFFKITLPIFLVAAAIVFFVAKHREKNNVDTGEPAKVLNVDTNDNTFPKPE